ncbi:MAG: two-component sensor histidine kinase [Deltaproteobacteria bacterium]|nr:MAG: two-component sensor histidine kinase [Deltaproteobacteria bacterium]
MHGNDLTRKLRWLMRFRVLFAVVLVGSTSLVRIWSGGPEPAIPFLYIYGFSAGLTFLSFCYYLFDFFCMSQRVMAYVQVLGDTVAVSFIVFITGGSASAFSFLYLIVIICASMLLMRQGSLVTATAGSLQYGVMLDLEYFRIIEPIFKVNGAEGLTAPDGLQVLYRLMITILACYAVAILSSFLAEQERKAKRELQQMEAHMHRMEKLAAIGEMAAGLAHEIKNPLASLSGAVQMLSEDSACDPDADALMHIVLREADRLSNLVSDFLLFAKPSKGKARIIHLTESVDELILLFSKGLGEDSNVRIETRLNANATVKIDPGHLKQILWNLLLNAADAMPEGGTIKVSSCLLKDGDVSLRISDTGCGMPPETVSNIFDPFFTTKPHGVGLGLSIVHQLITSYGGRLFVQSTPEAGSVFTLRLPPHPGDPA